MDKKTFEIPVDILFDSFDDYLATNDKGILSAEFGSGKSYFLSKYIQSERAKNKYMFIPIYPIHYQVAENKDIFEYIKRDILLQLILLGENLFDEIAIKKYISLSSFVNENALSLAGELAPFLPAISIGPLSWDIKNVFTSIKKIKNKYSECKKELDLDGKKEEFLKQFDEKGCIYEFDAITELIRSVISNLKEQTNKQIVLVIEDLDRIDPDHVFRILNILSAHSDYRINLKTFSTQNVEVNKFRFDKLLLVCDINNIKNIYYHRYGENSDFYGYIHKYYNSGPYHFSLAQELLVNIDAIYEKIVKKQINKNSDYFRSSYSLVRGATFILLQILIEAKQINIRQVTHRKEFRLIEQAQVEKLFYSFDLLAELIGSKEELKKAFIKIPSDKYKFYFTKQEECLFHLLIETLSNKYYIDSKDLDCNKDTDSYVYTLSEERKYMFLAKYSDKIENEEKFISFKEALLDAYHYYLEKN